MSASICNASRTSRTCLCMPTATTMCRRWRRCWMFLKRIYEEPSRLSWKRGSWLSIDILDVYCPHLTECMNKFRAFSQLAEALPEATSIRYNTLVYELQRKHKDVTVLSLGESFLDRKSTRLNSSHSS